MKRRPQDQHRNRPRKPGPRPAPGGGWDHVADWYDRLVGDEGSDYHRNVILPTALRLLAPQPGERILDLCCGQGVLTRIIAEKTAEAASARTDARRRPAPGSPPDDSAVHVVGVDASPRLIAAAKSRGPADPRVRYIVCDATNLGDLADGRFDAAACVMAVQDVADIPALFRELGRTLRPGGRAVIVMMHPCFRVPRQSDWGWDEAKKTQYRRIDRYLSSMAVPIATHPGSDPGQHTYFHHRPLQDYINALGAAGLAVVAAEEPVTHREPPRGARYRGQKRSFQEIPVFLALKALKLP
ncbi:MAG TPA: methyltransferase domain-containing protein [Phycisphaerae bacterium]|nr:methyltransferase domain-containing protein [Phycisphaerae bacterium]HON68093.1 methyltransferase domain-containing protein [Phycisphaerae bacterium]